MARVGRHPFGWCVVHHVNTYGDSGTVYVTGGQPVWLSGQFFCADLAR